MNETVVRILTADGSGAADSIGDAFVAAELAIAAVTSISPADACTVAAKLSLRYAVQCWDAPNEGKAIFWKPAVALQGLYRTEFQSRDAKLAFAPRGLLRVTFLWDGRAMHVLCAQLSAARDEADWQLVQIARELNDTRGPTILAIDPADARIPTWPGYFDAWSSALWRSIGYPSTYDVGDAARAAFGIPASATSTGGDPSAWMGGGPVRLHCSDHFSVARASHRPWPDAASGRGLLLADLIAHANVGTNDNLDRDAHSPAHRDSAVRAPTYPA